MEGSGAGLKWKERPALLILTGGGLWGHRRTQRDPKRHVKTADHSQQSPYDTGEVSWHPWKYREEFVIGKNRMKLKLG